MRLALTITVGSVRHASVMGAIAILMTSQVLWRADIIGMPSMLKLQMALTYGFVDLASNAFRSPSAGHGLR
jgi:hypothetical protein